MEGMTMEGLDERDELRLHAYHDGELSGFARWRFERALRRSPVLQRELESLRSLRTLLHAHDTEQDASAPAVDLWDRIALGPAGRGRGPRGTRLAGADERAPARGSRAGG